MKLEMNFIEFLGTKSFHNGDETIFLKDFKYNYMKDYEVNAFWRARLPDKGKQIYTVDYILQQIERDKMSDLYNEIKEKYPEELL